jgi:hypothetical protein
MPSVAESLGAEFIRTCRPDRAVAARPVAGLEHEFTIWAGAEQQDFRTLVHTRTWDGICIDPGDPNAYRCSWGGVVTADGREAEVVTPPMAMTPGFSERLIRTAATGRAVLAEQLPELRLDGYSTHLSFEVPDRRVPRVARRFAQHFAPALMLLLERHDSRGVLIRPRRDRLELCGEFLSGPQLQAAIVFAAGAAQACASRRGLPPRLRVKLAPSVHRFGTFVRRDAFRTDLYAEGRAAVLRTRSGRRMTAQEHLEEAWRVARPHAARIATEAELTIVDRVVAGDAPLAVEREPGSGPIAPSRVGTESGDSQSARLIRPRVRGQVTVTPHLSTWDATAFTLEAGRARAVVVVTRAELEGFLDALDSARLDRWLERVTASASQLPVLDQVADPAQPGVYSGVKSPSALIRGERDPLTGRIGGGRGGRDHKRRNDDRPRRRPRVRRPVLVGAAVLAVVAAIAGVAVAAGGGSDKPDTRAAGTPSGAGVTSNPSTSRGGAIVTPTEGLGLEGLSGKWRVTTANPRVLVGTGAFSTSKLLFVGNTVREEHSEPAGLSSSQTTRTDGVLTFDCAKRTCFVLPFGEGSPHLTIRDGKLANFQSNGGPCNVKAPAGLTDIKHNGSIADTSSITSIEYGTEALSSWTDDCASKFLGAFDVTLTRVS